MRRFGAECDGPDVLLGVSVSMQLCLELCRQVEDCSFVAYGIGKKRGQCHWEVNSCLEFEDDSYIVYDVRQSRVTVDDERGDAPAGDCTRSCEFEDAGSALLVSSVPAVGEEEDWLEEEPRTLADEGIDLLVTEEGWGLSSANWIIRRSDWSINFLERAFELCHRELPLFGDQDAMIHLLLNSRALQYGFKGDPLDPHAVIVPQREINAYDSLNAHYMGCDGYEDGDLLVTFPGCKDPQACNPLFEIAAAHAKGEDAAAAAEDAASGLQSAHRLRLFGPPELAAAMFEAARHHHADD